MLANMAIKAIVTNNSVSVNPRQDATRDRNNVVRLTGDWNKTELMIQLQKNSGPNQYPHSTSPCNESCHDHPKKNKRTSKRPLVA
jgi:hypothetical protein